MNKTSKFIITEIIYNGHLQSFGASSIIFLSFTLFNSLSFIQTLFLSLIFYLVFQTIYYFDRLKDSIKDVFTNKERVEHINSYAKRIPYIIVTFTALSVILSFLLYDLKLVFVIILITFFGLIYPLYIKKLTKYIPLLKNVYVSLVYAFLPIIAFYVNSLFIYDKIISFGIFVFCNVILMQASLDEKDISSDKKDGLLTLPVLLGFKRSIYLLLFINILILLFSYITLAVQTNLKIYLFVSLNFIYITYFLSQILQSSKKGYLLAAALPLFWTFLWIFINIIL